MLSFFYEFVPQMKILTSVMLLLPFLSLSNPSSHLATQKCRATPNSTINFSLMLHIWKFNALADAFGLSLQGLPREPSWISWNNWHPPAVLIAVNLLLFLNNCFCLPDFSTATFLKYSLCLLHDQVMRVMGPPRGLPFVINFLN